MKQLTKILLYLTVIGYWYNLPVVSTSLFGGYNEFRLYDVSFALILFILIGTNNIRAVFSAIKQDIHLTRLLRFSNWSSIMIIPTIVLAIAFGQYVYIGMSIIFLYHLWIFLLVPGIVKSIFSPREKEKLIHIFLICFFIHLIVYNLQVAGVLGHLWPEVYTKVYGESSYSGSLGPNRITPGMMTLMGLVFSIFVVQITKFGSKIYLVAIINLIVGLPSLVLVGSRTALVGMIIFILIYILLFARKFILSLFVIIPLLFAYFTFQADSQRERLLQVVQYNEDKLLQGKRIEELNINEGYQNLGSGRAGIIENYFDYISNNIFVIPFGVGFNNRFLAFEQTKAASAHNIYLSLVNELGIVGLILYILWIFSYVNKNVLHQKLPASQIGLVKALSISMIITLFTGEHLYVYRPTFALLGTFVLINYLIFSTFRNRSTVSI